MMLILSIVFSKKHLFCHRYNLGHVQTLFSNSSLYAVKLGAVKKAIIDNAILGVEMPEVKELFAQLLEGFKSLKDISITDLPTDIQKELILYNIKE